jgi:O-antigen ligase
VLIAVALLAALVTAATSAEMPVWLSIAGALTVIAAFWRPTVALLAAVGLAPFGAMFAGVPVRATETLLWAFFAGWLMRLDEPLDRARSVPRSIVAIAAALASVVLASWWVIAAERAVGLPAWAYVLESIRSFPGDYLVSAGRDPETAAMLQMLLAIALCLAVPALSTHDPRIGQRAALTVAIAGLAVAAATIADVGIRYVATAYNPEVVTRYFRGERFSVHLADVNAAGSHYILAGLIAIAYARSGPARLAWIAGLIVMLPALWLAGSRTAIVAGVLMVATTWLLAQRGTRVGVRQPRVSRRALALAAGALLVVIAISSAWVSANATAEGSAGLSLGLRGEFLVTSARMLSTAPVFGVGIGRYYERSGEFMPPRIKEIYGRENAHNYFAQVLSELGILGGTLFIGWIGVALTRLWRHSRTETAPGLARALFIACGAYALTCLAGHPLLVVEAAVPFWAALGAGLALSRNPPGTDQAQTGWTTVAGILIVALVALTLPVRAAGRLYDDGAEFIPRGLHDERRDSQSGMIYRWTTDHAIVYVGNEPGLVVVPLRAREVPGVDGPFQVTVAVSGHTEQRRVVPTDKWLPVTIVLAEGGPGRMRRIDVRVNQTWSAARNLGDPSDARPMGVMLGEIDYRPRSSQ